MLRNMFVLFDFILFYLIMFWLESWMLWYIDEYVLIWFLFVVRSNAYLGLDFILFIFDIFVLILGCLDLY